MIDHDLDPVASGVIRMIHSQAFNLASEKAAQAEIQGALCAAGIVAEREVRLAPGDIIDFLLPSGLGIEVKLRGAAKRAVFAQLTRYAAHDRVRGLLLVTNLAMGLPPQVLGKPAWSASLGRGWV